MSRELNKGVEYYFDRMRKDAGIYVGYDEKEEVYLFKPTFGYTYERMEDNNLIPFFEINDYFTPVKRK